MSFPARLLLSLFCIVVLAVPATAADLRAMAGEDEPALHCQHEGPTAHGSHAADMAAQAQGSCDDCSVCTSHCTPVMVSASGCLAPTGGSVQAGALPQFLADITAAPELKPPRF